MSTINANAAKMPLKVSVKTLVEQTERGGDINFRFSSKSSAIEGTIGHQKLQKKRGSGYRAEESLESEYHVLGIDLKLRGRVDGYYFDPQHFIVEEIKTHRIAITSIPASIEHLYWAQLKVYASLLAKKYAVTELTLRLCYYNLDSEVESIIDKVVAAKDLEDYLNNLISRYIEFQYKQQLWVDKRNLSINEMQFPYGQFRKGQRDMAVLVFKAMRDASQLILQAPTGIGKTIACLFPALKALPLNNCHKIFFLSAKISGQDMAQRTISDLKNHSSVLQLRELTLTAKEKICFNKGSPCDAEHCEYARGYFDKLPAVMTALINKSVTLDRVEIEKIAQEHVMCPFELSLDLSLISDVVICDYNYVFDPIVYLRRYFDDTQIPFALLMDESHNLVERGRDMFSATLIKEDILSLKRLIKKDMPVLAKYLNKVNSQFLKLLKQTQEIDDKRAFKLEDRPSMLIKSLRELTNVMEDWLALNLSSYFQSQLLQLYFSIIRFLKTDEWVDHNYCYLLINEVTQSALKIYCLNPGDNLAEGFKRVQSSVCFSATLQPEAYFQQMIGVNKSADWYQIDSPFDAKKLGIFSTTYISTTYRNRDASLYELVDTIATILSSHEGKYIVYFPSYAYLNEVKHKFEERYPAWKTVSQEMEMDASEQAQFLESFKLDLQPILGFALMGGVFGEAIDLKGQALIGAIIVGVGLPQMGLERDLISHYFDKHAKGSGFEFAYQYPGINRVLQTAGRVIRSEKDKGIICLIDHRFNEQRYRQLLPSTWQIKPNRSREQLFQSLQMFWQ